MEFIITFVDPNTKLKTVELLEKGACRDDAIQAARTRGKIPPEYKVLATRRVS